jgi:hypothetical protein
VIALLGTPRQRGLMGRTALRYARAHLGRSAVLRRLELVVEAALSGRPEEMTVMPGPATEDATEAGRGC